MHNERGIIYWNGVSSEDFGIVVEEVPNLNRPSRKYDTYTVPGRNGVIVDQQDAYTNIDRIYKIWFTDRVNRSNAPELSREIAAWLYSVTGYAKLEDTFEPDIYRLAYFTGGLNIENHMQIYGMCEISFNCRPERFLQVGGSFVENPTTLRNPTTFRSKPLIKVEGSGNVNFTINGQTVTITGLTDYIYIDSDSMDCYRLSTENMNSKVTGDFPVLNPGDNTITKSSGITKLSIQPRYWIL